jgi:GGDEF domain-containing protein/CHASE3 domain sensor protein
MSVTGYGDIEGRASLIKRFFNFFFRLNIAKKILFGYLSLAALIIIISVFALSSLERLNKINESIIQRDAPVIEATDKMLDNLLAQELYARRYVILKRSAILALSWERSKEFDRMVKKIRELPIKHDVPVDRLSSLHMEYNNLFIKGFEYLKIPSSALAQKYNAQIKNKQEELIGLIKEISAQTQHAQNEKMLMTARIGTTAFRVIGVLCGVGIILCITVALLITRNISGSIHQLKRATEEISEGRFEYKSNLQKQDELGELYLAFGEMAKRLKLLERMYLDASPLTRLPGGAAIENVLKRMLNSDVPLAFCLLDMDGFKTFNDCYGYARGSEAIKATARIIEEVVAEVGIDEDFVGHIGGDDFVVITSPDRYPAISGAIIERFDKMIVDFYDPEDRDRGGITGRNRQGQEMKFPIMTISIAVVSNQYRELKDPIQVGKIAAELKEHAKSIPGSVCLVDQRKKDD